MADSNKVLIDDYMGAYEATKHLIHNKCRRIVHFSGPQTLEIFKNRLLGYKKALKDNNIPFDCTLVVASDLQEKDGEEIIKELLLKNIKIDAIFSGNDLAALGAIKYLKEIGKKIPEDIAIIGFSNRPSSQMIEPSLSTVERFGFEIGKEILPSIT